MAPYKPTFLDRHGPDGATVLRAAGYATLVVAASVPLSFVLLRHAEFSPLASGCLALVFGAATGALTILVAVAMSRTVGTPWNALMADGGSTPYARAYSEQQALVMQGKTPEALASFEAIIRESPERVDAMLRAAELYARDAQNPTRAAELFRAVQGTAGVSVADDVYATNRLVDLLTGPLDQPGKAMVELRRLIDRYPDSRAAAPAREALARLKHTAMGEPSASTSAHE